MSGVTTLLRSGKLPELSPSSERKLVQRVRTNPGTIKAQACHKLELDTAVPLSTVKY